MEAARRAVAATAARARRRISGSPSTGGALQKRPRGGAMVTSRIRMTWKGRVYVLCGAAAIGACGEGPTAPDPGQSGPHSLTVVVFYDENGNGALDATE